tara:strand:- start:12511 stop:12963 length:453 start_codon:yes stop_codon:yes gene_type:complete
MLPFLGGLLGGIGSAGLGALGAGGQLLGTGLATVAAPVASGIGAIGQGLGTLAGFKPPGAEFVGPPEKFGLSPFLKSVGQAGLDSTIASTISNATTPQQRISPQISAAPNMNYGTSQFAPSNQNQIGRFKPSKDYSRINQEMYSQYGSIY